MTPLDAQCLVPVAAFLTALALLLMRTPSLYLGLTMTCLFMVSSASLAGYVHGVAFGVPMPWFTPAHAQVVQYSGWGCLAMAGGIAVAWLRPLAGGGPAAQRLRAQGELLAQTPWINPRFAWFAFLAGSAATLVEGLTHNIATVGTAVHALASMATIGVLTMLASSVRERRLTQLTGMVIIYLPILLMRAFATGHSPLKVSLLLPAVCIVCGMRRVRLRSIVVAGLCGAVLLAIMTGWMQTRYLIRDGLLDGKSYSEKVAVFVPKWLDTAWDSAFDVTEANRTIRARVDMTDILAMQVRFQPHSRPYAKGQTVLDAGVALVPRILWRGKPVIAGGTAFVSRYTGMVRDPKDTTSIGLPYQFELYANGGPVCVVAGLFIIGFVCGWLERGLFVPATSLGSLLARLSILMTLCDGGQRADVVLPSLIAGGVCYFALGRMTERFAPDYGRRLLGLRPPARGWVRSAALAPK